VRWLLGTSLVARLPVAMANLAIILRVAGATGSYARAGAVTAAYVVGTGIMGPVLGRLADRIGRRPVLLLSAAVNAAGLISLAFIPVRETAVVLVVAALAGASVPPVAAAVRSLWASLVPGGGQSNLYALDATMQEATFMVGPTLVALLSSLSGPPAALVACGAIGLAGTFAVSLHPAVVSIGPAETLGVGAAIEPARPEGDPAQATVVAQAAGAPETGGPAEAAGAPETGGPAEAAGAPETGGPAEAAGAPVRRQQSTRWDRRFQPAGIPGLGSLVVIVLMFLAAILIVEVSVVAFAGDAGAKNQAGVLLAVWSMGSMLGGFVFGARSAHAGARVLAPLMVGGGLGFLLLAAAPGVAVLYGLLFLAGMSIAPGFSCIYGLVGNLSPSGISVEAFSWIASGIQMGAAGGAALGGLLVEDIGTHGSFAFAGGCGLVTAAIAWWRARHLQPS
jgi:MFS family permease